MHKDPIYNQVFFDGIEDGSTRSARVVVPLLLQLMNPASVVDVGCGRGAWLAVFKENGVKRADGIDGSYVDTARLLIPKECFRSADLNRPFEIEGSYDLAVCLEVAEHLGADMGPPLVRALTGAAPVVLFSAAIPGQGGQNHVNERWPSYWRELFAHRGFVFLDPLRARLLVDDRVEWWYRQNTVLYASESVFSTWPALKPYHSDGAPDIEWVRARIAQRDTSVKGLLKELRGAVTKAARRRLSSRLR